MQTSKNFKAESKSPPVVPDFKFLEEGKSEFVKNLKAVPVLQATIETEISALLKDIKPTGAKNLSDILKNLNMLLQYHLMYFSDKPFVMDVSGACAAEKRIKRLFDMFNTAREKFKKFSEQWNIQLCNDDVKTKLTFLTNQCLEKQSTTKQNQIQKILSSVLDQETPISKLKYYFETIILNNLEFETLRAKGKFRRLVFMCNTILRNEWQNKFTLNDFKNIFLVSFIPLPKNHFLFATANKLISAFNKSSTYAEVINAIIENMAQAECLKIKNGVRQIKDGIAYLYSKDNDDYSKKIAQSLNVCLEVLTASHWHPKRTNEIIKDLIALKIRILALPKKYKLRCYDNNSHAHREKVLAAIESLDAKKQFSERTFSDTPIASIIEDFLRDGDPSSLLTFISTPSLQDKTNILFYLDKGKESFDVGGPRHICSNLNRVLLFAEDHLIALSKYSFFAKSTQDISTIFLKLSQFCPPDDDAKKKNPPPMKPA